MKKWPNRPSASLSNTVKKFIGDKPVVYRSGKDKVIFLRSETGLQVVYDRSENYFRIEAVRHYKDATPAPTDYFDINGSMSTDKAKTHFNNVDFGNGNCIDDYLKTFGTSEIELLTRGGLGSKYYNVQQILPPLVHKDEGPQKSEDDEEDEENEKRKKGNTSKI